MLVGRVWPSRPMFEGPLSGFDQLRQGMASLLNIVAATRLVAAQRGLEGLR